jgi:hypothetical protein
VIVKISTSPSGVRRCYIPITNCRICGDEKCENIEPGIFTTIFEFHVLTKNEKTNFVIGAMDEYVMVGTMLQAAAKTHKYVCDYCC